MPRHTKFMFEANPRQQPSEMKTIPVTAIGKRNLSLARILYTRQRVLVALATVIGTQRKSLARVFAPLAGSLLRLGAWSLGNRGSLVWLSVAVCWLKARVCGLQAGCGQSGNYRRCGLKLDKKEPAILSFSLQE